jgi:hypothetical protein
LPLTSTTVTVNIVLPTRKLIGALLNTFATPQLSLVITLPNTTFVASQTPRFAFVVILFGQTIVGNSASLTITF